MRYQYVIGPILASILFVVACGSNNSDGASDEGTGLESTRAGGAAQVVGSDVDYDEGVVSVVSEMEVGSIYYISFDSEGLAEVDLSDSDAAAEYALIVQSTNNSSASVSIVSSDISLDVASSFDAALRHSEVELAEAAPALAEAGGDASISKAIGDTSSFRVLTSISSTSSYTTVTAVQKCVEDHIIAYVDSELPSSDLTDSDIELLCSQFELAASQEEDVFGSASDINGDGHVVALITPAVNRLGASGGGIITGYFWAGDLYANSGSNPASNEMEIIYVVAPDPDGEYGTAIDKSFAMSNLIPAVVPHELQHAINYNQHVLVNGGSAEKNWLNEAMSHFSEDLVGFGQENPSRVEVFLQSPESTSLAPSGLPTLGQRGAEYLFIRYLYEQSGNSSAFLAALEDTTLTGEENVVAAFAGASLSFDEWDEFMRGWAIAMATTNTGLAINSAFQFNDRTWNSDTERWQGACVICNAEDNRGTTLSGPTFNAFSEGTLNLSLSGTSTAFYSISLPPDSISITGDSSAGLHGVLIRTQ